jgi:predicted RNA-binding Zn-ribbon protein involved in translation (DUF1610 family)
MWCPECGRPMIKREREIGQEGEIWECEHCVLDYKIQRENVTGG